MTEKTRIPLPTDLATRDATVSHDGLLQNLYEENTPIGPMIVKRPGLTNNIALGPCVAQGSTFFNSNNYFICSNILYVNPAPSNVTTSCPVPVTFGSGSFAALDPVTGYVWTSDFSANKVNVYNPATQALITAISPPAGGKTGGGITYIPDSRKMVIASGDSLLSVDVWAVNADTYSSVQTVDFAGGSGYVPIAPIHFPTTNKMLVYSDAFGGNFSFNDSTFGSASGSNPFPSEGGFANYLYIPTKPFFAFSSGGSATIVVASSDFSSGINYSYSLFPASGAASPMCYDPVRNVIWIADIGDNSLYFVPMNENAAPGALTLKVHLPYSTSVRMCYDPYRDSLWILSDNNAGTTKHLLRVNPDSGAILNDCLGVDSFIPGGNAGTGLIMLGPHSMLNCTGRNSSSISLQYLAI